MEELLRKIDALPEVEEEPSTDERMLAAIQALTEAVGALKVSPESIAGLGGELKALCAHVSALSASVARLEAREIPVPERVDFSPVERRFSAIEKTLSGIADKLSAVLASQRESAVAVRTMVEASQAVLASRSGGFELEIGRDGNNLARKMVFKPSTST